MRFSETIQFFKQFCLDTIFHIYVRSKIDIKNISTADGC